MRYKKGFTLAEVLITLGIIGVVASMTIPALCANARNKDLQSRLKKAYNIIQNAVLAVSNEEGYFGNNYSGRTYKDKFKNQFNVLMDCNINCLTYSDMHKYKYKTFSNQDPDMKFFDDGQFFLVDGSFIMIDNWYANQLYISVDLNGPYKKPNTWGIDIFTFEINPEGAVIPAGTPNTTYEEKNIYCSKTSSDEHNGIGCTYYALYDKDYWGLF